jgi:hypothetical protein
LKFEHRYKTQLWFFQFLLLYKCAVCVPSFLYVSTSNLVSVIFKRTYFRLNKLHKEDIKHSLFSKLCVSSWCCYFSLLTLPCHAMSVLIQFCYSHRLLTILIFCASVYI